MSTVLYLSNQEIQVITGSEGQRHVSISDYFETVAPEGSIINGMITNVEEFQEFIKEFWKENKLSKKDVILIVSSTKFVGKIVEMPNVGKHRKYEFIHRDFSDTRQSEHPVYGYVDLNSIGKKGKRVYAEAISEEYIKDYLEIFREVGIELKAIYSTEGSMIHLVELTNSSKYKTFIFLIAEKTKITSLLFVGGSFYQLSSSRTFYDQGTEEYLDDMIRMTSKIKQFMQANQIEEEIEGVIIAGIHEDALSTLQEKIAAEDIRANVELLRGNKAISGATTAHSYVNAISGLFATKKEQNYISQLKNKRKYEGFFVQQRTTIGVIAGIAMALLVVWSATGIIRFEKQKYLEEVEAYNTNPEILSQLEKYDELQEKITMLEKKKAAISNIDSNIATYPKCDYKVRNILKECAKNLVTTSLSSYESKEGIVTFSAQASNVDKINIFIKNLNAKKVFNSIDYTGYSYDESTKKWDVHVYCVLQANDEK